MGEDEGKEGKGASTSSRRELGERERAVAVACRCRGEVNEAEAKA